ncbi:hypothetical protein, partial [Helicobacter bizzozeronii]|uniref:hypothetical protein n=2 Tax=Helicobacter bizzozeronii TaxID=56877 RepID=UPI001F48D1B4
KTGIACSMRWVFICLLGLVCLQATPSLKARDKLIQWMGDFVQKSANTYDYYEVSSDIEQQQTIHIHGKPYTFLYAHAQTYLSGGQKGVSSVCVGVVFEGKLYKGFCLEGFGRVVWRKNDSLIDQFSLRLLPSMPTPTAPQTSSLDVAFHLISGTFYLSRLEENMGDQTRILYLQSRDDPSNAQKLPMAVLNASFLERLKVLSSFSTQSPIQANSLTYLPLGGQKYALIINTSPSNSELTQSLKCVGVVQITENLLKGSFCIFGYSQVHFSHQEDFLRFEFSDTPQNALQHKLFITFKFDKGAFLLHQLGRQNVKTAPQGVQKILKTQVIYRQDRDDPNHQAPMGMDSLRADLITKLLSKCRKNGYCI